MFLEWKKFFKLWQIHRFEFEMKINEQINEQKKERNNEKNYTMIWCFIQWIELRGLRILS